MLSFYSGHFWLCVLSKETYLGVVLSCALRDNSRIRQLADYLATRGTELAVLTSGGLDSLRTSQVVDYNMYNSGTAQLADVAANVKHTARSTSRTQGRGA